jgi:hypothetical protein
MSTVRREFLIGITGLFVGDLETAKWFVWMEKKPNEQHRLRCSCRHLSICFAGGFYHKNPMCQCHLDIRNQIRGIHGSPWLFAEFWAPNGGGDITNSIKYIYIYSVYIYIVCVYIYISCMYI